MGVFEVEELALPGVLRFTPVIREDHRGSFTKSYHLPDWEAHGVRFSMREEFYSISGKHVLRGMHFQVPPAAHQKVVTCLRGRILDVVVDLRRGSPCYGEHVALELDDRQRQLLFLPTGLAHGFLSLEPETLVLYKTDAEYAPEYDAGIRYDSFGFSWPNPEPILSRRDQEFPAFGAGFQSPFGD